MLRQVRMGLLEICQCAAFILLEHFLCWCYFLLGILHSIILGPGEEDVTHLKNKLFACTKVPVENQVDLFFF